MRYKKGEIPELFCDYCGKRIEDIRNGRVRRRDTKYCNQKCHDAHRYEKESKPVKQFREDFGINKYIYKGLEKKFLLIDMFGGECEKCGYSKNMSALEFHHINPDNKIFEVQISELNYKKDDDILEEALKCMLLCSNCHRELHSPHYEMEHVKRIIEIQNKN